MDAIPTRGEPDPSGPPPPMSPKCPGGNLSAETSASAGARWISRLVPCFLLLLVAYATYVVVGRICGTSSSPTIPFPLPTTAQPNRARTDETV